MNEFSPVAVNDWLLGSGTDPALVSAALMEIDPIDLAKNVAVKVKRSFERQSHEMSVASYDEDSQDGELHRHCLIAAIDDDVLFNQLFNGRCGYRAMYYRCPDIGEAYNKLIVEGVIDALFSSKKVRSSKTLSSLDQRSLRAKTAKMWPFFEVSYEPSGTLEVTRWSQHAFGSRLFRPHPPVITIKGGFLDRDGSEHDLKPDRSQQLHETGWT